MNPLHNGQGKTPVGLFLFLLITKILPLIEINLLFILTSLPVLTFPPSLAAMNKTMQHLLTGGEESIWKVYFRAFKTEFLASFGIGALSILLLSGLAYGAYFYYLNNDTWIYVFFFFFLVLLFILSYSILMWAYLMKVSVKLPLKSVLKNAIILTFSYPKQTLFGSIGSLSVLIAGVFWFPYSTPLLLLIVFSFAVFLSTFSCFPVIQREIIQ